MRIALLLIAALALSGCRHHEVPPLGTSAEMNTAGTDHVASGPIRLELRRFYAECEERRDRLQEDVDEAGERLRRISGAAAVAWFIAEMAAGRSGGRAVSSSEPTSPDCLASDGPGAGTADCNPGTLTTLQGGQPSPTVIETRSVELDADSQIRAINRAIEDADDLLFEHPDPDQWTAAEEERWAQLLEVLEALCH